MHLLQQGILVQPAAGAIDQRITGSREPICRDCVARVNPLRIRSGLPPVTFAADAL